MGRGPVVGAKKAVSDKARGKAFAIHAKLIALAARNGGDPNMNPALYDALEKARKANVPADNIERAIKKGTGADKDSTEIDEIIYEGYSPGGVAIVVKTLTDNKNRTAKNMRHAFSQYGGNLGETGSVSNFAFRYQGYIETSMGTHSMDQWEEWIIESGASDYEFLEDDTKVRISTERTNLMGAVKFLKGQGLTLDNYGLEYAATNVVNIDDPEKILKLYALLADFEDDDDVEQVWHNAEIDPVLWQQAEEAMNKGRFRT
ncbi:MAG: YebC/PmpR family DNA-binding transcriptional regulator [Candidatus Gracilibacteria bacterium]|nr:YebC/PmpR family DNA-binding transcriptional regulator [Candidatus Gracilibacteria bacterium]